MTCMTILTICRVYQANIARFRRIRPRLNLGVRMESTAGRRAPVRCPARKIIYGILVCASVNQGFLNKGSAYLLHRVTPRRTAIVLPKFSLDASNDIIIERTRQTKIITAKVERLLLSIVISPNLLNVIRVTTAVIAFYCAPQVCAITTKVKLFSQHINSCHRVIQRHRNISCAQTVSICLGYLEHPQMDTIGCN